MNIDSQITFLPTLDLVATSRFYEEVLGLRLVLDQGRCRIYAVAGDAFIGFCQRDRVSPTQDVILTLVTPDVDGFCQHLKGQGVRIEQDPAFNAEYRIYHFFLRDPNGYTIEMQRFEDPEWRFADE